jgi:predicted phage tail protein
VFSIQTAVTDPSGVASVTVTVRKVGGGFTQALPMALVGGDVYAVAFDSASATIGSYVVDITAVDSSPNSNQQTVTAAVGFEIVVPMPGAFSKIAPANGATNQPTSLTLTWGTSTDATSYEYCIDTSNNGACDASWNNVGLVTSAALSELTTGTTYSWQVRAVNAQGNTQANGGTWWAFTTQPMPSAFSKVAPANGATNQPTSLSLTWSTSADATSYEYCIDTSNNGACDASWSNVGNVTSAAVSGLVAGTTYSWQVRAVNAQGNTQANGGAWWTFTTQAMPGAFSKINPANGATNQPTSLSLTWGTSADATSYEYCIDTSNNANCDASWVSVGNVTSATLSGLATGTTFSWQVRAVNAQGNTQANGGAWWTFTTLDTQPDLPFEDGFESGDTSAWSATVP